ncbi:hypothetical protein KC887_04890 [Candidatus Kaiserbacteria bacterium]|nr:hypothetical protein [Candidatus Kaiserbacteria bacterium]
MTTMKRPFLKLRLTTNDITSRAVAIIERWKRGRSASTHLPRAIVIYEGLLNGDLKPLLDEFPLLANGIMHNTTPTFELKMRDYGDAPVIEYVEEDDAEKLANFKNAFGR